MWEAMASWGGMCGGVEDVLVVGLTWFLVNGLEQFGSNAPPDTSVPPAVPNLPDTTLLVLRSILGVFLVPNPYLYSKYRIFKILKLLAELLKKYCTVIDTA